MTNNLLTQMRNAPDDPAAMLLPSATRALTIASIELTSRCSEHSLLGAQLARSSLLGAACGLSRWIQPFLSSRAMRSATAGITASECATWSSSQRSLSCDWHSEAVRAAFTAAAAHSRALAFSERSSATRSCARSAA